MRAAALASLVDNFPELATPVLISLALDPSSPERLPAIRTLGKHLAAEVEGTLEQLTGDMDGDVREAAKIELARRHARRARQTNRVRAWLRRPIRSVRRSSAASSISPRSRP